MKKPNLQLEFIVRNLNILHGENVYRIVEKCSRFYVERNFNDKFVMRIHSCNQWKFKTTVEIYLYKVDSSIDHIKVIMNVTDVQRLDGIIKDIEKLVKLNWDGTKWDSVNDSERRGTWYTDCNH
jgi:hypothetical protein